MKRLLALTLVFLVLTAAPAFAVLRILPDEVQERLHGLALEEYPGYQVEESWVQDFVATGREVFNISLVKDDEKVLVQVDVAAEVVLSAQEMEAIIEAETEAQTENPVFTILQAPESAPATDLVLVGGEAETGKGLWIIGGVIGLALAGGTALYLKKK